MPVRGLNFIFLLTVLVAYSLLFPVAVSAGGTVVNISEAAMKISPNSGIVVRYLVAPPTSKSAFVAHLTVKAGTEGPLHRDASAEYIYVISGSGKTWIDDVEFEVKPGSLVYMPAQAKVKFIAGAKEDMTAIQIWAPPGPEKKYADWKWIKQPDKQDSKETKDQ